MHTLYCYRLGYAGSCVDEKAMHYLANRFRKQLPPVSAPAKTTRLKKWLAGWLGRDCRQTNHLCLMGPIDSVMVGNKDALAVYRRQVREATAYATDRDGMEGTHGYGV